MPARIPSPNRLPIAALSALLAVGCSDSPLQTPTAGVSDETLTSRTAGYRRVIVRQGMPDAPGEAGAPVVNSIAAGLERLAPGGTLSIHPGTYSADSIVIDRPVTIEAASAGQKPLIVNGPGSIAAFVVTTGGSAVFRGLSFRNEYEQQATPRTSASIRAVGGYASIVVENSDFTAVHGLPLNFISSAGIAAFQSTAPGASLVVRNSSFSGGNTGISTDLLQVTIEGSSFTGQALNGIRASGNITVAGNTLKNCGYRCITLIGGTATVTNNTATDCGYYSCITSSNTATVVSGNRLSNSVYSPSWFLHHVVLYIGGSGRVENNEIDGCGFGQCITGVLRAEVDIAGNRITAYHDQATRIAIVASDNEAGNSAFKDRGARLRVSGNTITGIGGDAASNPWNGTAYAFSISGIHVEGHSSATIDGNSITNANMAILARTGGVVPSGSGNTISVARLGFGIWDQPTSVTMHGNDITGTTRSLEQWNSSASLTCNWWGRASGPVDPVSQIGPSVYTPWATAPVVGSGQVGCS